MEVSRQEYWSGLPFPPLGYFPDPGTLHESLMSPALAGLLNKCVIIRFIFRSLIMSQGLPWWLRGQSVCLQCGRPGLDPWAGKIPWRRKWQLTPVLLPGKSHGQRSLVGYSPWGHKKSDTTTQLHSTSPLCLEGFPGGSNSKESACNVGDLGLIPELERSPGEGNGNPLQYSCLENPMDRGAWRATVHGVTKSWTQLSG